MSNKKREKGQCGGFVSWELDLFRECLHGHAGLIAIVTPNAESSNLLWET